MNETGTYSIPYKMGKDDIAPEIKKVMSNLGVNIEDGLRVNEAELGVVNCRGEEPVGKLTLTQYKGNNGAVFPTLYHLQGNINGEKIDEIFKDIKGFFDYQNKLREEEQLVLKDQIAYQFTKIRDRIIPKGDNKDIFYGFLGF